MPLPHYSSANVKTYPGVPVIASNADVAFSIDETSFGSLERRGVSLEEVKGLSEAIVSIKENIMTFNENYMEDGSVYPTDLLRKLSGIEFDLRVTYNINETTKHVVEGKCYFARLVSEFDFDYSNYYKTKLARIRFVTYK